MTPELAAACGKALHVLTADGQLLRAGRASLFVLGETGHPWLARILGLPPMVWLVELGYAIVAPEPLRSSRAYGGRRAERLLLSETFRPLLFIDLPATGCLRFR